MRRIDAATGVITTVAGTPGIQGYSGDGTTATASHLTFPQGVALDKAGDLLIADTGNNRVREVDVTTSIIRTVAGTGTPGFSGDSELAVNAALNSPWNLAVGQDGSLLIADLTNNRVRKVNPSGIISTVTGTGTRGFGGNGGNAASAQLGRPAAVVIDPAGDLYIADSDNNRVCEIKVAPDTANKNAAIALESAPAVINHRGCTVSGGPPIDIEAINSAANDTALSVSSNPTPR